jgi:RHS repeat-associated protein
MAGGQGGRSQKRLPGFRANAQLGDELSRHADGNRILTKRQRDLPYPISFVIPAQRLITIGKLYRCGIFRCAGYVLDSSNVIAEFSGRHRIQDMRHDLLGSLRINFKNAQISNEVNYQPFGIPSIRDYGKHDFDLSNAFLFTGQRYDSRAGLYWYQTRDYDPQIGRYLSPDVGYGHQDTPQELNRYSYVRNNPQSRTDSSGADDNGPDDGEYNPPDVSSGSDYGYPAPPINTVVYGPEEGSSTTIH